MSNLRLFEEFADFGGDGDELVAAAQQPHLRRAQQPQPGLECRLQRMLVVRVHIVARAEQGEIVSGQPFEKLDRFGNVGGRQRRRIFPQIGDDFARAREHRLPVLHAHAHLGENVFERANDVGLCRRLLQAVDVNVDEALAAPFALARAFEANEVSGLVALDREHRMHQERNVETAFVEFAEHRIDEERHVVIDDIEHRCASRCGGGRQPHLGRTCRALRKKCPRVIGDRGEFFRTVAFEVLGRSKPKSSAKKSVGMPGSRNASAAVAAPMSDWLPLLASLRTLSWIAMFPPSAPRRIFAILLARRTHPLQRHL